MRYATVVLSWGDESLHPLDDEMALAPCVTFEAVHYANPIGDGTYVELLQFRGELEVIHDLFEDNSRVIEYEVSDTDPNFVYLHYETTPALEALLSSIYEYNVVLKMPVQIITGSSGHLLRGTLIGSKTALRDAIDALPDWIEISSFRTGEYTDTIDNPMQALSGKQRELLGEALRTGYYDVPREITQAELAESLGVTAGTVGDRLRRLESTLIKAVATDIRLEES